MKPSLLFSFLKDPFFQIFFVGFLILTINSKDACNQVCMSGFKTHHGLKLFCTKVGQASYAIKDLRKASNRWLVPDACIWPDPTWLNLMISLAWTLLFVSP